MNNQNYFKIVIYIFLLSLFAPIWALSSSGDFTSDQDVDGSDLFWLRNYWNTSDLIADLNEDSVLDGNDIGIFCQTFGKKDAIIPEVTIENLSPNSFVLTGFIKGIATDNLGIDSVYVKLDTGSYAKALGTVNWTYKLPCGPDTWKTGSIHTISIYATDTAGNMSMVQTITVKKGNNKDINGDGYADLAIGAPGTHSLGNVMIYEGNKSGISSIPATTITGQTLTNSFGDVMTLGDVNGDGYADLAIGCLGYSSSLGRVYIFHGSADGIGDVDLSTGQTPDTTLTGEFEVASTNFGTNVAFGDTNGDGYDDLSVEAPGWYGKVYIFKGGPSGIPDKDLSAGDLADTTIRAEHGGDFGDCLAMGDLNGDGFQDLCIGARGYSDSQGRVYIFYGRPAGFPDTDMRAGGVSDAALSGLSGSYGFGYRITTGYINDDMYADIIVGSAKDFYQGYVHIFHGAPGIIPDTDLSAGGVADTTITGLPVLSQFGFSIAAGDINGDGLDDLAIGAHCYNTYKGRVHIWASMPSGIPDTDLSVTSADATITGEYYYHYLGYDLCLTDVTGDGYADIAVGAPGYSNWTGRAYLFYGSDMSLNDIDLSAGGTADVTFTGNSNSDFGQAMAK